MAGNSSSNRFAALTLALTLILSVFAVGGVAAQESAANEQVEITDAPGELVNEDGEDVTFNYSVSADADVERNLTVSVTDENGTEVSSIDMGSQPVYADGPLTGSWDLNAESIDAAGNYTVTVSYGDASASTGLTVVEPSEDPGPGGVLPDSGVDPIVVIGVIAVIVLAAAAVAVND